MTVDELIKELENCDKDLEVSYEVGSDRIELLIGEDPDASNASSIIIIHPGW